MMRDELRRYLMTKNIKYYFYTYSESMDTDYQIDGDVIYIRGTETFLPGITEKTIKAFEICQQIGSEYDYLVRSNISSVINFDLLNQHINYSPPFEYGGNLLVLKWLDPKSGIIDNRYKGICFMSGCCIILSKNIVKLIVDNKNNINYNLIDDVTIGHFIKNHKPNAKIKKINKQFIENVSSSSQHHIIYRNKRRDRMNDVIAMRNIINKLLNHVPAV